MDNLSPTGQLRPNSGLSRLLNNYGFLNFGHVNREPDPAGGGGGGDAEAAAAAAKAEADAAAAAASKPTGQWKSFMGTDLKDSPLLAKFDDTPEGLNKAFESHGNLEKLLGHEKVPIPKDEKDVEGWARWNKAMGIPEKPELYGLADLDPTIPKEIQGMMMPKDKFAQLMIANRQTPAQAKALWTMYQNENIAKYNAEVAGFQATIEANMTTLRSEWGESYQSKVEMGQNVINKFADSPKMNNYLTAVLSKDPQGIKFLAKIGSQFAENKISGFEAARFTKSPTEAQAEIDKIRSDRNHPYLNPKATKAEHDSAVSYVNSLIAIVARAKG